MKKLSALSTTARFILLLIISLLWGLPLLWSIWSSIRPAKMVTSFDFNLVFSMENFEYVFKYWDFFIYLEFTI